MWDFLDTTNYNLLYEYLEKLSGKRKHFDWYIKDEYTVRNNWFYLVWFVFRYIMQCKTLDDACSLEERYHIFKMYGFSSALYNYYFFVGGGEHKLPLYKDSDIKIILEILYNRYDYLAQLECFAQNTTKSRKKRCLDAIKQYKSFKKELNEGKQDE